MSNHTLISMLQNNAARLNNQLAYRFLAEGDTFGIQETRSHAALYERAKAIGAWLQNHSKPGARAVLLYAPGLDFIEGFFGAQLGGMIAVPAYPPDLSRIERSLPRLRAILADCEASFVLTTRPLLDLAESFFSMSPELANFRWIATDEIPEALSDDWTDPRPKPSEVSFLQYTSGSTGEPKGVRVTHRNLIENLRGTKDFVALGEPLRIVSWLPPYHDMGLIGALLLSIYTGGHCTFFSPLDFLAKPLRWLQAISEFQANLSPAPNFAYELCTRKINDEERERLNLHSWRAAPNAGEPIRAETITRFCERFKGCGFSPLALCPAYGMAETTLTASATSPKRGATSRSFDKEALGQGLAIPSDTGRALVSSGEVLAGQTIRIVDPETRRVQRPDQLGEIWIQGSFVADGYWQKPALTAEVFQAKLADSDEGAFLRSGDLGFLYEGELYLTGRRKDLLIIRGRNHSPQDIEQSVEKAHPAIRPGCVIAFSIEQDSEEALGVVAEIDTRKASNPEEIFRDLSRAVSIGHDLAVASIWLIAPGKLPKTSSGKLQRAACREGIQQGSIQALHAWTPAKTPPKKAPEEKRHAAPNEYTARLLQLVARALSIEPAQLDPEAPLSQYGLDSVMAIELSHRLTEALGQSVSTSLFWSHPTLNKLAKHLETAPHAKTPMLEIKPTPPQDHYPLSFVEQGLFRLLERQPRQEVYNLFVPIRISGPIDASTLEQALNQLIARQESLRTGFTREANVPTRRVYQNITYKLPAQDLRAVPPKEQEPAVRAIAEELRHLHFDLAKPPLFAARLVLLTDDSALLFVSINHLIADGWGLGVIQREVTELYEAISSRRAPQLPTLKLQASDYALAADRAFAEILSKGPSAYPPYPASDFRFPYDAPLPQSPSIKGARHFFLIDHGLRDRVISTGKAHGFSLSSACLAAFQVALHRLSQKEEVLFAVIHGNRRFYPMRELVGYFVYSELFHGEVKGNYLNLLQKTNRFILEERPEEQPRVFVTQPPQLRIVFNFHNFEVVPSRFTPAPEYNTWPYLWDVHDLLMQLFPTPYGVVCDAAYRSEVIKEETLQRFAQLMLESLAELAQNPSQNL